MGHTSEGEETILVVDDTESVRKMICALLTQSGYRCIQAADASEALQLLDGTNRVHLILTDMVMPRMSGAELAKRVSAERPDLRIMFMSGYAEDLAIRMPENTPWAFLAKPFTAASLNEKIRKTLDLPWTGLPDFLRDSDRFDGAGPSNRRV